MVSFSSNLSSQYKPATIYCQVAQGKYLHCISGGAFIRIALGFDISHQDLLALTPRGERETRLSYWWQVVQGAVSVTYRQFTSKDGQSGLVQGVALPFSDEKPDGSRYFLMHTNWRPVGTDWVGGNVKVDFQNTSERRMAKFREPVADISEDTVML
jgi:hypothetical protein